MATLVIAEDISSRIAIDFGDVRSRGVLAVVDTFVQAFDRHYAQRPSDRILRCVIHLAMGDSDKLDHYLRAAFEDWRDVILFAEYDHNEIRRFDFNRPFPEAAIDGIAT